MYATKPAKTTHRTNEKHQNSAKGHHSHKRNSPRDQPENSKNIFQTTQQQQSHNFTTHAKTKTPHNLKNQTKIPDNLNKISYNNNRGTHNTNKGQSPEHPTTASKILNKPDRKTRLNVELCTPGGKIIWERWTLKSLVSLSHFREGSETVSNCTRTCEFRKKHIQLWWSD